MALPVLLFGAHFTFGAARIETALLFSAIYGLFAALLMVQPWARRGLSQVRGLPLLAAGMTLTAAAVTWPLTPFVPDGPHPIWTYVASTPAGVIDRSAVLIELLKLGGLACAFTAAVALASSRRRARVLFNTILIISVGYVTWACAAHLIDPHSMFGAPKPGPSMRLNGSFLSPNTAGALFGVLLVMSTTRLLDVFQQTAGASAEFVIRRAALAATATMLSIVALLLSASRGAIAATAVSLALVLIIDAFNSRRRLKASATLVGAALCVALVPLLLRAGGLAADRYATISGPLSSRSALYEAHWTAFNSAPWTGYGLGSFETVNQMIMNASNFDSLRGIFAMHNVYLQWLLETGVVGAAVMFSTIGLVLLPIIAATLRGHHGPVANAVAAGSLVLLLHGLTDFAIQVPSMQAFWACLLGLGYGHVRGGR